MNLFDEKDRDHLVGPARLFDRKRLTNEHGQWGHQLLGAATAMEALGQITERGPEVLLKGGTLLQHSISWPPYRASVDLDLEVKDASALEETLLQIEDTFSRSEVDLNVHHETPLPGLTAHLRFPRSPGPNWSLRIDVLENDRWPARSGPWQEIPEPWAQATLPLAADAEVRAAQKLLIAAEPYYGRGLTSNHRGRQNFVKDLFDLRCLGHETLEAKGLIEAAGEDVERKSDYLGEDHQLEELLDQAKATFRHFAHPPVDDDTLRGSLWRAYDKVKGGIRIPFTRADLRATAGCAHHCIQAIERDRLDWEEAWRPAVDQQPRTPWTDEPIRPVLEVEDDYGPTVGPLEAWARFEP